MLNIDENKRFSSFFLEVKESRKIEFLVLHHIEANNLDEAIAELVKHEVSSHFIIDENGYIYQLVAENNIAYHAGVSFWRGIDGLNKSSIGIEFVTKDAFKIGYSAKQLESGAQLTKYLVEKYDIKAQNIVAHSDIAYAKESGFLDRKQDPSHLFDWQFMNKHAIGIYPNVGLEKDSVLFKIGDKDEKIGKIKQFLAEFGYKINNFDNQFDDEMIYVVRVFHRRFNQKTFQSTPDNWYQSSQFILDNLINAIT